MGHKIVKLTPTQKYIASRMRETIVNNPQAVTAFDVDMGPLLKMKQDYLSKGKNITVTAFLIKALAVALERSPMLNSRFENDEFMVYEEINVGVAMSTERGLIVPVIREVGKIDLEEIGKKLKEIKEKFQEGELTMEDLQGSTVTISSLGFGRNDMILPILNNNESLLIGAARTRKMPAVMEDGSIGVKDIANISCTNNHCVTYGEPIGRFCTDYAEIIENPEKYFA